MGDVQNASRPADTSSHDDWVRQFSGVDPAVYVTAPPPGGEGAPGAGEPEPNQSVAPSDDAGPPPPPAPSANNEPNQSVAPSDDAGPPAPPAPSADDQPNQSVAPSDDAGPPAPSADAEPSQPAPPSNAAPPVPPVAPPAPSGDEANSSVDPSQPASPLHAVWQEGYDAAKAAPDQDHPAPIPYDADAVAAYAEGVAAAKAASGPAAATSPPAVPAAADTGVSVPVDVVFEWEFDLGPKASLKYIAAQGKLKYAVSARLGTASSDAEGKIKLLQGAAEATIKKKLWDGVTLKEGDKSDGKKASLFVELSVDNSKTVQTKVAVEVVKFDKGKVSFCELRWDEVYTLAEDTVIVEGQAIKYGGKVSTGIAFTPNWSEIGKWVLEKLGVELAEGAVAGGTGTAGAVAIAVAPAAGVIGGIVGGVGLCAGVCAAIDKLQDLGKDAMEVCQQGRRELYDYATSYGATMRGKPGSNAQGNADAEAALQKIMQQNPGITHEQAVQAAIDSKNKYEDIAWRAVLPVMRQKIEQTYRDKEGTLGFFFSGNVLFQVMNDVIAADSHY